MVVTLNLVRNKEVGEPVLSVKRAQHLLLFNLEDRTLGSCRSGSHADGLVGGDAPFAQEIARAK